MLLRKDGGIAKIDPMEVTLAPRMALLHQPSTRSEPQAKVFLDLLKTDYFF